MVGVVSANILFSLKNYSKFVAENYSINPSISKPIYYTRCTRQLVQYVYQDNGLSDSSKKTNTRTVQKVRGNYLLGLVYRMLPKSSIQLLSNRESWLVLGIPCPWRFLPGSIVGFYRFIRICFYCIVYLFLWHTFL